MSTSKTKNYSFFLPISFYKRIFKSLNPNRRIFKSFLEYVDDNLRLKNRLVIDRICELKRCKKTLTIYDLERAAELSSYYRVEPPSSSFKVEHKVLTNRIKKNFIDSSKVHLTPAAWTFLSEALLDRLARIGQRIEEYCELAKRSSLHKVDIKLLFETDTIFLI